MGLQKIDNPQSYYEMAAQLRSVADAEPDPHRAAIIRHIAADYDRMGDAARRRAGARDDHGTP